MKNKTKENKKMEMAIIIVCLLIILPLVLIAKYNRPSSDDHNYGALTHQVVEQKGGPLQIVSAAWETNMNYYQTWQGLYTSAFLLSLVPSIFGEQYYALSSIIVMTICYLALLGAIHIFNKHFLKHSFLYSVTLSLVIFTILFAFLPCPSEGLYWYNGAMNYTPWTFVNLLNVALLIEIGHTDSRKKQIFLIIVGSIIGFLTSGANHVTSFANILILLTISVYLEIMHYKHKKEENNEKHKQERQEIFSTKVMLNKMTDN